MKESDAITYLAPPPHAFWRWSADGQTLEWADGRTIAFRQEVHAVLHRLMRDGLPPFGAVVLLLAACRNTWGESGHDRNLVTAYARSLTASRAPETATAMDVVAAKLAATTARTLEGLDGIGRLLPDLRTLLPAKASLAEIVFDGATRVAEGRMAAEIVSRLERESFSPGEAPRVTFGEAQSLNEFVAALEALAPGLPGIREDRIRLRERTGLEQLVEAPDDLDLSPAARVRRMLADLRRGDPELAALAKLAQDVLAAVHVPRALTATLDLPVGGVSDISHRGPLDRLLVSELAHDDLTLAVRVATNEALYLRREAPPQPPPNRRALLIDCGIRMWGVPRVFAAAVSLALIANADAKAEVVAYRAGDGGGVEPADLTRRDGLIAHLEKLCTSPHPGRSVGPFLDTVGGDDALTESILVTHENALADASFTAACAKLGEQPWHVATVDRDGAFKLYAVTREGRRVVCQAKLSLDGVLATPTGPAPSPKPLLDPARAADLPAILSIEPFPILLPFNPAGDSSCVSKQHGLVGVCQGRLMHWHRPVTGRELTARLPRGRVEGMMIRDDVADACVVIGSKSGGWATRRTLVIANLVSGHTRQIVLESADAPALGIARHNDALLVFFEGSVEAFEFGSGERLATMRLPNAAYRWTHGRFLRTGFREFNAVAFDGGGLRLEPVPAVDDTLAVFEHAGSTMVMSSAGRIVYLENPSVVRCPPMPNTLITETTIAHDGRRIAVRTSTRKLISVEVPGKQGWIEAARNRPDALLGPWGEEPRLREKPGVRNRFEGVIFHRGDVVLISRPARRMLAIARHGRNLVLSDRGVFDSGLQHKLIPFQSAESPPGARYELSAARLPDGRRIFLDSRGLLHLRTSGGVELTIVLAGTGPLAGWMSDGRVFGPAFFHGRDDAMADVLPLEHVLSKIAGVDVP